MLKRIFKYSTLIFLGILVSSCNDYKSIRESKEVVYFRLAETHPGDFPTTIADREFARLVEEKTNGRIIIKVYDNESLGDEACVIEQVQFGGIDFARVMIGRVAEFSPELNVLQLPYLYRDDEHMWKVLNSHIGDYFLKSIEDEGFIGLGWYGAGARNFYNSVKEINSLEDFQGLRFRVVESEMAKDMIRALGASPVFIPYGKLYDALQIGEVDGAENNFPSYETSSHYKVAKYYTLDEHMRVPEILIASKKIMERITEEDLEIIKECARQTQLFQRELWRKKEKESKDKVYQAGCIITEIEDKEEFIKAVEPLYDKYAKDYMDIVKEIKEMR